MASAPPIQVWEELAGATRGIFLLNGWLARPPPAVAGCGEEFPTCARARVRPRDRKSLHIRARLRTCGRVGDQTEVGQMLPVGRGHVGLWRGGGTCSRSESGAGGGPSPVHGSRSADAGQVEHGSDRDDFDPKGGGGGVSQVALRCSLAFGQTVRDRPNLSRNKNNVSGNFPASAGQLRPTLALC